MRVDAIGEPVAQVERDDFEKASKRVVLLCSEKSRSLKDMAETLFIADESDARRSIEAVTASLPVLFLQEKRWDTPSPVPSRDLSDYPVICRTDLTFFVLRSPAYLKTREIKGSDGRYFGNLTTVEQTGGSWWRQAGLGRKAVTSAGCLAASGQTC